jgi:hypothetical protein
LYRTARFGILAVLLSIGEFGRCTLNWYTEKDFMFKIVMITSAIVVGMGWIAYAVWRIRDYFQEKKRPKPTTKHLQEVKKSFDDYLKKVASFEKPTYKREGEK